MDEPLERVAVVGSGILRTQIAMMAAHAWYAVTVYDEREEAFTETYNKIKSDLTAKQAPPLIPWEEWEKCKAAVQRVTSVDEAVGAAELVIEAAPENIRLKNHLFKELSRKSPPNAILVTNSSSIPVSRMEDSSGRPERCLNIHFYFSLQGVKIVDIMGDSRTLPEVMQTGVNWINSIGCIPLKVNEEILGFHFNCVWRAIKREVLYMWGNGFVDFRDSDRAWIVFTKMKEGPFALMDKVGLDVICDIEMVYYNDSKDLRDKPPDALMEMIKRGEFGVKSGKEF